jgi:hypothetical protein
MKRQMPAYDSEEPSKKRTRSPSFNSISNSPSFASSLSATGYASVSAFQDPSLYPELSFYPSNEIHTGPQSMPEHESGQYDHASTGSSSFCNPYMDQNSYVVPNSSTHHAYSLPTQHPWFIPPIPAYPIQNGAPDITIPGPYSVTTTPSDPIPPDLRSHASTYPSAAAPNMSTRPFVSRVYQPLHTRRPLAAPYTFTVPSQLPDYSVGPDQGSEQSPIMFEGSHQALSAAPFPSCCQQPSYSPQTLGGGRSSTNPSFIHGQSFITPDLREFRAGHPPNGRVLEVILQTTSFRNRPLDYKNRLIVIRSYPGGRAVGVMFKAHKRLEAHSSVSGLGETLTGLLHETVKMLDDTDGLSIQMSNQLRIFLVCLNAQEFCLILDENTLIPLESQARRLLELLQSPVNQEDAATPEERKILTNNPMVRQHMIWMEDRLFTISQAYALIGEWKLDKVNVHPQPNLN